MLIRPARAPPKATKWTRAASLDSFAWALVQSGELDRAFECCRQARQFWLESGDADAILRNMSSTLRMAFLLRATTHWFSKDEVVAALELEERVSQSFDRAILLFYLADGSAKEGDLESARQLLTQVSHYRELTTASAQRAEILRWVSTFELSFMLGVPRQAMEAVLLEARSSNSDLLAAQCWILLMGIADNSCDLLGGRKLFADGMAHCAERDLIGPMTMLQGFERRFGLNSIATKNR